MATGSVKSAFGTLDVACAAEGVVFCAWRRPRAKPAWPAALAAAATSDGGDATAICAETMSQLRAYFAGKRVRFDLPLFFEGTPFEIDVWRCVSTLAVGDRVSYADVAHAVGRPNSHRGVARAMGRTPYDVLVPAQRVLGADGRVRGAGPESMRVRLLAFETALVRTRTKTSST